MAWCGRFVEDVMVAVAVPANGGGAKESFRGVCSFLEDPAKMSGRFNPAAPQDLFSCGCPPLISNTSARQMHHSIEVIKVGVVF